LLGILLFGLFAENVFYGLLGIASIALLAIFIFIFLRVKKFREEKRQRILSIQINQERENALCIHGVKGGLTMGFCAICVEDNRKARIKDDAAKLRNTELKRLGLIVRRRHEAELFSISPKEFENEIARMYHRLGYSVKQTPYSNDFGKDIIVKKDGFKYVIECKRWNADKRIDRPTLQKLYAAMVEEKAYGAILVATCDFTKPAIEYAKDKNIELVGLDKLVLLRQKSLPDLYIEYYIKVMCIECGDIVEFAIEDANSEKNCLNGHKVCSDIKKSDIN
jgi:restriction system protein